MLTGPRSRVQCFGLRVQLLYVAMADRLIASGEQPKQIIEIKDFLLTARRKDASCEHPAQLPPPSAASLSPFHPTQPLQSCRAPFAAERSAGRGLGRSCWGRGAWTRARPCGPGQRKAGGCFVTAFERSCRATGPREGVARNTSVGACYVAEECIAGVECRPAAEQSVVPDQNNP